MREEHLKDIIDLRHELHAHPELSGEERRTKETLMAFLRERTGLELVDRGKWFYAYYCCGRTGAEAVAFRADFDALPISEEGTFAYASRNPGVSHKCGHDGHSAALCGMALELDENGAEKDVYLIFQHGEETGSGGEECAGLIAEKHISEIYAFHNTSGYPESSIVVRSGVTQCASKGLTVRFVGQVAHASRPESGKNPAKAASRLVLRIGEEEQEPGYGGLVMATIVQVAVGSKNFGIAASEGEVSMTLRAYYEHDMKLLEDDIRDYAEKLAEAEGLKVSFEESDVFPETVNDAAAVKRVKKAAGELGFPVFQLDEPLRASEDFGYYLKQCPGMIFYIGNGEEYPQIHTAGFDFNDRILVTAVEMFKTILESA